METAFALFASAANDIQNQPHQPNTHALIRTPPRSLIPNNKRQTHCLRQHQTLAFALRFALLLRALTPERREKAVLFNTGNRLYLIDVCTSGLKALHNSAMIRRGSSRIIAACRFIDMFIRVFCVDGPKRRPQGRPAVFLINF